MKKTLKAVVSAAIAAGMMLSVTGITASAGWVKDGTDYYYENSDGSYKTGWIETTGGDYYYFLKDGKMARSCTVSINGVKYKFESNGKLSEDSAKPTITTSSTTSSKSTSSNTTSSKAADTSDSESGKAIKNQNTFPALVTYGVYCGMSYSDFKALDSFEEFKWNSSLEAYVLENESCVVYVEDGVVTEILRERIAKYGYTTRSGYKDSDSAKKAVTSWQSSELKSHKDKELVLDERTESTFTDGYAYYRTECDGVYYVMSDLRWDYSGDTYGAIDGYIYVG